MRYTEDMYNIVVEKNFKEQFLQCGRTYDNFIFENCPIEFLKLAEQSLAIGENGTYPCNIKVGKNEEKIIEKVFSNDINDYQKKILARYFITTLLVAELFKNFDRQIYEELKQEIVEFKNNNFQQIKKNYLKSFMPFDIARISKKLVIEIELNVFLCDMKNVELQQAINNFIASREPYSVKIFSTNERLASYYDQNGNLIQSPHDYMTRNVYDFISYEKTI